jgi:hypothetical protein
MTHMPAAGELLALWEDGLSLSPTGRAMLLLTAMFPDRTRDELTIMTIGQRDAELLRFRQALWGPGMLALAACPACREQLELTLDTGEMLSESHSAESGEISMNFADFNLTLRVPTVQDLLEVETQADAENARWLLLDCCLVHLQRADTPAAEPAGSDALPAEVVEAIARRMAEADPLADVQLNLTCPSCRHRWSASFDIISFLWTEMEAWAARILTEVHILAQAYSWSESEILSLSSMRRQFYLNMVGA